VIPRNIYVDVENTLTVSFISGIQRVVKELLVQLAAQPKSDFVFIPVVHCRYCHGWRQLSDAERTSLYSSGSPGKSVSAHSQMFRRLAGKLLGENASATLREFRIWCQHVQEHKKLRLADFASGSIFLDLEASWHNPLLRNSLLPALRRNGVSVVTLHYDIIPILFPDRTHRNTVRVFTRHLHAHLAHSDLIICISHHSELELIRYACQQVGHQQLNTAVLRLGSNIRRTVAPNTRWPLPKDISKFVLCVGTVEPRKNHEILLDAFDAISQDYPDLGLVIVGRLGWDSDRVIKRIQQHSRYDVRLFWLQNIDDDTLSELYRRAYLNVVPSLYEGFGLPITEALQCGSVTLSSHAGALPEAGGDFVTYFDPNRGDELASRLRELLEDLAQYKERKSTLDKYVPTFWEQTADELRAVIRKHF